MSILSINGNRSMNILLQTVLAKRHKLILVSDAFQAMYQLKHYPNIDLIIVDMDYQTQENRDFIDHVQTSCLYAKPVIVLSSNKTDSEAGELLTEAQVYHCFTKPFNPLELVRCINELMKSAPVQIINKN